MKEKVVSDAVVTFDNARPWVEVLFREDPDAVAKRMLAAEPAIMSAVAVAGKRTIDILEQHGASDQMMSFVLTQMLFAGAIGVELMKKGNGLLFSDLIEAENDKSKGATNDGYQ